MISFRIFPPDAISARLPKQGGYGGEKGRQHGSRLRTTVEVDREPRASAEQD
jgi:hypothetical protein